MGHEAIKRHAALTRGGKFSRELIGRIKMHDMLALLPVVKASEKRNLGERVLRKGELKRRNPQKDPKLNPQEAPEMRARQ